jgi:hypothetical protein
VPATAAAGLVGIAAGVFLDHWLVWPRPPTHPAPAQIRMTPTNVGMEVAVPDPSDGAETLVSMPVGSAPRAHEPPSSPESGTLLVNESLATGRSEVLPEHLRDALDLFVDYPIIRDLDKFEHYETIEAGGSVTGGETRGG